MKRLWLSSVALAVLLGTAGFAPADEKKTSLPAFGALESVTPKDARAKAEAWLREVGKADGATTQALDALWRQEHRTVLDRTADSIALGDAAAAKLLADARDPLKPAPTKVPEFFKDAKVPAFVRTNVGLAYARALANRKVYEEALEVLKATSAEQAVDPAAYLFTRAVSEHAMLQKAEATKTIQRLLDEAAGIAPERYKTVGALILLDMHTWKDKDLGSVARKMKVVEERLDLARGGPKTQKIQKEIVTRLDEMIKELENKKKGGS